LPVEALGFGKSVLLIENHLQIEAAQVFRRGGDSSVENLLHVDQLDGSAVVQHIEVMAVYEESHDQVMQETQVVAASGMDNGE
jgi:hypothetical protein